MDRKSDVITIRWRRIDRKPIPLLLPGMRAQPRLNAVAQGFRETGPARGRGSVVEPGWQIADPGLQSRRRGVQAKRALDRKTYAKWA